MTVKPTQVGGLPVSLNPIGYVDLASWQADWNAGDAFFTDCQDDDTVPIYTGDQVGRLVELAQANVQAQEARLVALRDEWAGRSHRFHGMGGQYVAELLTDELTALLESKP